jgi:ABC-type transporter Mla subunit MlaD
VSILLPVDVEVSLQGLDRLTVALEQFHTTLITVGGRIVESLDHLNQTIDQIGTTISTGFEGVGSSLQTLGDHVSAEIGQIADALTRAQLGDAAAIDEARTRLAALDMSLQQGFQSVQDEVGTIQTQVDNIVTPPPPMP